MPPPVETRATLDDLGRAEGKAELIGGRIVRLMGSGRRPVRVAGRLFRSLDDHAVATGRGEANTDGLSFAVEVRGEDDYGPAAEREMAAKRADYFEAGTRVVWDVDTVAEVIRSYKAEGPTHPATFARGEEAGAEPAASGWRIAVDAVFA